MSGEGNTNGKSFICDQCEKSYKSRISLKRHKLIHPSEKPFECDECTYKGPYDYSLKYHKLLVHDYKRKISLTKPRNSTVVFVNPNTATATASSSKSKTNAVVQVVRCQPDTVIKKTAKPAVTVPDLKPPLKCKLCNSWFQSKAHLEKHALKHSEDTKPKYLHQCHNCLSWPVFKTKEDLEDHLLTHAIKDDDSFQCDECNFKGKHEAGLKSHKLFIHNYKSKLDARRPKSSSNIVFVRPAVKKSFISDELHREPS